MPATDPNTGHLELIRDAEPDMHALFAELRTTVTDGEMFYIRQDRAWDSRYCVWPGQTPDGRKHSSNYGKPVFPWDGASDTRIRTGDEIVNEQVMMVLNAFFAAQIQAVGNTSSDVQQSSKINALLKWMFYVQMSDHLRRELELAINWRQEWGLSFLSVKWEQKRQVMMQTIDAEYVRDMLSQAPDQQSKMMIIDVASAFMDPLREQEALGMLQQMSPLVTPAMARKLLKQFRVSGKMELPTPDILSNRPVWRAMRPFMDIFFPTGTSNIQDAPWVAEVELVTEAELENRIDTEGYDEEFVAEALKHRGQPSSSLGWRSRLDLMRWENFNGRQYLQHRNEVELVHFYYKDANQYGHPTLYRTISCQSALAERRGPQYALHEVFSYEHGMYPFAPLARENITPRLMDSRGVPEIAAPWQNEIKLQRDSRADRTTIATLPPLIIPSGRGATDLKMGPGVQITSRRGMDPSWMQTPPFDQGSIEIERSVLSSVDRYFGRISETVPQPLQQLHQQHLVTGVLGELGHAIQQTFQLMQQYMDDQQVQQVVGLINQPFHVSREEIQGAFHFFLSFDVRDLDLEYVKAKLMAIQTMVLPMDKFGAIDSTQIVDWAMRSIDSQLADRSIQNPQQASQKEVADEKQNLALMFSGQEAPMPEGNMNYPLRKQVLTQTIQANPEIQQQLMQRPIFKAMVEQRLKYLDFQIQQQQNAQTGRTGGQQVLPQPV
jgi:hypothetical protein